MSSLVTTPGVSTTGITTTSVLLAQPLNQAISTVSSELGKIHTAISTFKATHTLDVIHNRTLPVTASSRSQTVLLDTGAILVSIQKIKEKFNDKDALVNNLGQKVLSTIKDQIKTQILDVLQTSIGDEVKSLEIALQDVKNNLETEKKEINKLLTSIETNHNLAVSAKLEENSSRLETNVMDLITTANSLVSLNKDFKQQNLDLNTNINTLTLQIKTLDNQVNILTGENTGLNKQLVDLDEKNKIKEKEYDDLKKNIEKTVLEVDILKNLGAKSSFDFGSMQRVYSEIHAYSKTFLPETPQRTNLMYYNFIMILVTCLSYACFWCNANRLYTTPAIAENFTGYNSCGKDQREADSILGLVMSLDWIRCYITMLILPSSIIWYNHYIEDMDSRTFVSKNKARKRAIVYIVLILIALLVSMASIALFIMLSYYSQTCVGSLFGMGVYATQMVSIWVPFILSFLSFVLWISTIYLNRFFFEKSDETSTFRLGFEAVFLGFHILPALYSTKKQDALFETHTI